MPRFRGLRAGGGRCGQGWALETGARLLILPLLAAHHGQLVSPSFTFPSVKRGIFLEGKDELMP